MIFPCMGFLKSFSMLFRACGNLEFLCFYVLEETGVSGKNIWASSWENLSSGVSDQVGLKLACSTTKASMRLEILVKETGDITLSRQRTTKALIRLRGCAGRSAPLLFAYDIRHIFSWPGSFEYATNTLPNDNTREQTPAVTSLAQLVACQLCSLTFNPGVESLSPCPSAYWNIPFFPYRWFKGSCHLQVKVCSRRLVLVNRRTDKENISW